MTLDQERWAEAQMLIGQHGSDTSLRIAERVAALASAGDEAGIVRWREIVRRVDELLRLPGQA